MPLLVGSYAFYSYWKIQYTVILLLCTVGTYFSGLSLCKFPQKRQQKIILFLSVLFNLGLLAGFKYINFFLNSLNFLLSFDDPGYSLPYVNIFFPVGVSFYTFQSVSYIADVYRGKVKPESHFGYFALYLAFFPKLISGPIERAAGLLPQLKNKNRVNFSNVYSGLSLFIWGLFKKLVIADRLGMYVDMVFSNPEAFYGKTIIVAGWMFSLQIYCDFSAYMDMAIGCGRLFGIELSRNFNFPYMAMSIGDFWRRWHITLTSWFRDYVYIPLGGNQVSVQRWVINIMIVFLASGLWHGAAWTFVWWGALHGFFYLIGKFTAAARERLRERSGIRGRIAMAIQVFFTFQLVSLAWVFFRAETIEDAFCLIQNMSVNLALPVRMMSSQFSTALAFSAAVILVGMEFLLYWLNQKEIDPFHFFPPVIRYPVCALGLLVIALFGVSRNEFIYFQF